MDIDLFFFISEAISPETGVLWKMYIKPLK